MAQRFTRWGKKPEPIAAATPVPSTPASMPQSLAPSKSDVPSVAHMQCRAFARAIAAEKQTGLALVRRVNGVCIPYQVLTEDCGGFREMYAPGSFGASLTNGNNKLLLFNGNTDIIFGCSDAGTARFSELPDGIHVQCDMPQTSAGNDTLTLMRRGDITNMAAFFMIVKHHFETIKGERVRVVDKGDLIAASIYGAPTMNGAMCDVDQAIQDAAAKAHIEGLRAGIARGRQTSAGPGDGAFVDSRNSEFNAKFRGGLYYRKAFQR
jgi:HK97 family phage prohead protease